MAPVRPSLGMKANLLLGNSGAVVCGAAVAPFIQRQESVIRPMLRNP